MGDDVLDGLGHVGEVLVGDITGVDDSAQVVEGTVEAGGVARETDESKLDGLVESGGKVSKLALMKDIGNGKIILARLEG